VDQVICVGHSTSDRVFTVDAWPQASAKLRARSFVEAGGGMAANAAVAIARLGGAANCGWTALNSAAAWRCAAPIRAYAQRSIRLQAR